MSGHSKWSTIKRKKAAVDAKRGTLFTRLLREIQVAAKTGGSVDGNPRLKTAVAAAKAQSVPNDNIDKAIKRGTGDMEGVDYEEINYEAYGPGGVAILIKTVTDNRKRTVAEVRHALTKYNGSLAGTNAVAYKFRDKGICTLPISEASEEELINLVLEAGAEDVENQGDVWEVTCELAAFDNVKESLEAAGKSFTAEQRLIPDTLVPVAGEAAESLVKLMDALDELDDVQDVVSNFDMDEGELERLGE